MRGVSVLVDEIDAVLHRLQRLHELQRVDTKVYQKWNPKLLEAKREFLALSDKDEVEA